MARIVLQTLINASKEKCFDLSRDIDLHIRSMKDSKEQAVAGIASGLIQLNETVTWKATHFGVPMKMCIRITEMQYPDRFTDEMLTGPFKSLKHIHQFKQQGDQCLMIDEFVFESPLGLLGKMVDTLFLIGYMTSLLKERNKVIKETAEAIV